MKLLTYSTIIVLLVMLSACSVNEDKFPIPLDTVLNTNGAYLSILSVESAGFDILDLDNAAYTFLGEYFDKENGSLLQNIEFFVSYNSADGTTISETSSPVKVYQPADLSTGPNGLPTTTFNITIQDVMNGLGLTVDDLLIGDRFQLRWQINLTTGQSFTRGDVNASAEAAFSTPYQANVNVVAAIPQEQFVGTYTLVQQARSTSVSAAFGTGWLFNSSESFEVNINVDPDNTLNGRMFTATPMAEFGVPSRTYIFSLAVANDPANNSATISGNVTTGLTCGGGLFYGPAVENRGSFDVSDDSEFILSIRENALGDCGLPDVEVLFTATKN